MNDCKAHACASQGCGHTIHLHHDLEERLRRTQETFYCPAGHSNYFPAKKDDTAARLARAERQRDEWRERWQEQYERADEWRLHAKRCSFGCGFYSRKRIPDAITADLVLHMVEEHGARMPEPIEQEVVA